MGKSSSSRLASPAQVAKRLAAERDKASRAPEILSQLSEVLSALEKQQVDIQSLPFSDLLVSLDQLRGDLAPIDYGEKLEILANGTAEMLQKLEEQRKVVSEGLGSVIDLLTAISEPEKVEFPPMPPDVSPDIAALSRKLEKMAKLMAENEPQPEIPRHFEFSGITRDENGDIATARVDAKTITH